MGKLSSKTWVIFSAAILFAGAIWIYFSRTEANSVSAGNIPAPRTGFLAPDFSLADASGKLIRLSDLRGKPVLLNIWASWCGPCRAEMPAIQRVYQDYQPAGLEILAVNSTTQDTPQNALAFTRELGLTFPVLFDHQGEAAQQYHIQSLPSTFFIDDEGVIQDVVIGGPMAEALLRIRIEQLLSTSNQEQP